MRLTSLLFCLLLTRASHGDLTIFDVRRNLPLSDTEKVYHDYLVDSGAESGLKQGMELTVSRSQPIYDYYRFRPVGDLNLKVAKVKVIAVQDGMSVVRLRDEISRQDTPVLDDEAIMIGDKLDMSSVVVADNALTAPTVVDVPAATAQPGRAGGPAAVAQIVVNSVDLTPKDQPAAPATVPAPATAVTPAPTPAGPRVPAGQ